MVRGNFFYKKIGQSIAIIRRSKGITQEKLALLADVDRTYLSRIEEGKANPSMKVLGKLSRILHVKVNKLMGKI